MEAAAALLPRLPEHHRLELIKVCASRGHLNLVRELQKGWAEPDSKAAVEGRSWLALLDETTPFPPKTNPTELLFQCPDLSSLERLLEVFTFQPEELIAAAYNCKGKEFVHRLLREAEGKAEPEDFSAIARSYLLLDDTKAIRRLNKRSTLTDPVLRVWLSPDRVSDQVYYPDFLSSTRQELKAWREQSAELAAVHIFQGKIQQAEERMQRAWLQRSEVTEAARRLAHLELRLAVSRYFGDVKEEGRIRLPLVNGEQRKKLVERLTNVPDGGDGYPDFRIPAYFLREVNTEMPRATFDSLYEATTFSIMGFPGHQIRRQYDYHFSLLYESYDPTAQIRRLVHDERDTETRFEGLLRLGRYYPSESWPIHEEDKELLRALPESVVR